MRKPLNQVFEVVE